MRVIPVLDVLEGKVVHAVAGRRSDYLPIRSRITSSVRPADVASDLRRLFPFREVYIADLDAIEGTGENIRDVFAVRDLGYSVYLDCGVQGAGDIDANLKRVERLVIGTETLQSIRELESACRLHPWVVVSLDFKGDELLARDRSLMGMSPARLVEAVCQAGASELIYLDLRRVGTGSGVMSSRLQAILDASEVPVLVGGGVRDSGDVKALEEAGAAGVLVATAIHSGALTRQEIERLVGSPA